MLADDTTIVNSGKTSDPLVGKELAAEHDRMILL